MPKHKEPTSLEAIAMKNLVKFAVRFCDQLSTEGTLQMLREGISIVKEDFCTRIPWCSLPEFCTTFLKEFCQKSRDKRHYEAALEIVLDVEFVGLRYDGTILRHLTRQNMHRLRGLRELEIPYNLPTIIEKYHLDDLTTLIIPKCCVDRHLKVIGRNCPKLKVLKLPNSRITDDGVRALSLCSDLRVVDISGCFRVTDIGVNHLISAHNKLEELSYGVVRYWDRGCQSDDNGCRFLSSSNRPCSLMKRFHVTTRVVTNADLRYVVSTFPNLTHFETSYSSVGDLSILKSLRQLEGISYKFDSRSSDDNDSAWQSLKELLTFVGGNIKTLSFCSSFSYRNFSKGYVPEKTGLDFIFRSCPNIECLEFDYGYEDLVIPPFKKLKTLKLTQKHISNTSHTPRNVIQLSNIGEMLNLEVLTIANFIIGFQTVEAIVLDGVKFPKLMRINSSNVEKIDEIREIARNNNLDFKISNY